MIDDVSTAFNHRMYTVSFCIVSNDDILLGLEITPEDELRAQVIPREKEYLFEGKYIYFQVKLGTCDSLRDVTPSFIHSVSLVGYEFNIHSLDNVNDGTRR
jgi:hypothetical protein